MKVPTGSCSGAFEVKKSKFLYHALPAADPEEVKKHIAAARAAHPQANHVVHAFILGKQGDIFGMSDDHEPKHTAGRPALEVLKGSGITNVLVLIIRYFGGTKLGTGGLVKAYGEAAKRAVAELATEPLTEKDRFLLRIPYPLYDQVTLLLQEYRGEVFQERFATEITLEGQIPRDRTEALQHQLQELSAGSVSLEL